MIVGCNFGPKRLQRGMKQFVDHSLQCLRNLLFDFGRHMMIGKPTAQPLPFGHLDVSRVLPQACMVGMVVRWCVLARNRSVSSSMIR